jgi:glycosyltransferase involved in cell wall biosynthesis
MHIDETIPKFALISHTLPPSPSGQAIVLYHLLSNLPADAYCLLSQENYDRTPLSSDASARLPGRYYHLQTSFAKTLLTPFTRPVILRKIVSLILRGYNFLVIRYLSRDLLLKAPLEIYLRSRQIRRIAQRENCQVMIACTANLFNLPATYWASRALGLPFIPYIFDDYTNQWLGLSRKFARWWEPTLIKNAASVIVPNEYMAAEYKRRYNVQSVIVRNLTELPDLATLEREQPYFAAGTVNIVYTGAVYLAHYQAIFNLLSALERLCRPEVKLHIFTSVPHPMLQRDGLVSPYLVLHNHQPLEQILTITRQADILFLPLAFDSQLEAVIKTALPGKTGAYLAVGRPILVHAPADSFISGYFREHGCGYVVDQNDVDLLAEAVTRLLSDQELQQHLSARARQQALKDFDAAQAHRPFVAMLRRVCGEESA